jgi:hypothetical protein
LLLQFVERLLLGDVVLELDEMVEGVDVMLKAKLDDLSLFLDGSLLRCLRCLCDAGSGDETGSEEEGEVA